MFLKMKLRESLVYDDAANDAWDHGQIQAKTGKVPTMDNVLKELLDSYKKKRK